MKKTTLLSILMASATAIQIASADTLAQWTFELNTPADATDTTTISGLLADLGTGTASGLHAATATDWTTPTGNGSANSLSANTWGIGDYFQFSVSSIGYQGLGISFDQVSSGTGPGQFYVAYSSDGTTFTQFGSSYTVLANSSPNSWSSSTAITTTSFSFDLSSITTLNNAAAIYFRLVDASTVSANGGTTAAGGTSRVDNFTISATPVPEPSVAAILGGFGILGLFMAARQRK